MHKAFNRLVVVVGRNLFEDRAKLERGFLTECAFEAMLRRGPVRTGLGNDSLPGFRERHQTAASVVVRYLDLDETTLLQWAQKMPQCRAIRDQKPCEILDRPRTDAAQPRQDGEF